MTLWEATQNGATVIVSLTPSLPISDEHLYRVKQTHPYYAECWPIYYIDGNWKVSSTAQKLTVPWEREVKVVVRL